MTEARSLTSRAHASIRAMVLSGELPPGARIQIDMICMKLDMGASPVREALSILSSEQLVVRHEQRGFRAADVSAENFAVLLETRCRIEGLALRDAIASGDAAWEERIVMLRHRLGTLDRSIMPEAWENAHRDFHAALIAACPSRYLLVFCGQLYDLAVRYRNIARFAPLPARRIEAEHAEIAEAALARDADRAVVLINAHYRTTGAFLFRQLAEAEAAMPAVG